VVMLGVQRTGPGPVGDACERGIVQGAVELGDVASRPNPGLSGKELVGAGFRVSFASTLAPMMEEVSGADGHFADFNSNTSDIA
jgi:hypothetical protein